jgi:hypothetical protein
MTDDIKATVVAPAARGALHRRGHRVIWAGVIITVLGLVLVGFVLAGFDSKVDELTTQVQQAQSSAQENHVVAQQLHDQVQRLGGTPAAVPPGPSGAQGLPGRGITGTAIIGGHMFVSYTDNKTEDKGQVVGKDGAPGANGRGITGSVLSGGHLFFSYTDNTTQDIGQVVGPPGAKGDPGRSVRSMDGSTGHLIVTYDDNTTQDVGPLPAGPPGPKGDKGDPGPTCPSGYEQHEAVITANDGTKYDGIACVNPSTATTTTTPPPLLGGGKR